MNKKTKKIGYKAKYLKENINNFAGTLNNFIQSLEKLISYLDTTNKLKILSSLSKYPHETEKFNAEIREYGLGLFLWFEKEYPNISDIFKKSGFLFSLIKIKNIKRCIVEYNQLIEKTKQKYQDITELEINKSQELLTNTHLNPIKILTIKSHLWRKIEENTSIYIDKLIKSIPALKIYYEIFFKIIRFETARDRVKRGRRSRKSLFRSTEKMFKRIKKEFEKKCPQGILNEVQELGQYGNVIIDDLDYIEEHKKEDFYNLLELSKDLYEFHVDFVKYILRIWHIYENGNRDYVNNYKIKHKFPNINTIINHYINKKLDQVCPSLSRALTGFFFPFEKYRHIESHSAPKLGLSADGKYIFIPQKGKKHKLKVEISEIKTFIRTYQSFIEALKIYR